MGIILVLLLVGGIGYVLIKTSSTQKKIKSMDVVWVDSILNAQVKFYAKRSEGEKKTRFLERVIHFIQTTTFTNVGSATHTLEDEVLIAASAMIPLYHFPEWDYFNLDEILLYEDAFDERYQTDDDHPILGMVGEGALQRTMLLSLKTVREGFQKNDADHTPIHEFVHLIDKMDGSTDGVPEYFIPKELVEPWLRLVRSNMQLIKQGQSGLEPYAATNEAEFLSVMSEYFFEKPEYLERNHPALYQLMNRIFTRN